MDELAWMMFAQTRRPPRFGVQTAAGKELKPAIRFKA
jgi:hypothetical protein